MVTAKQVVFGRIKNNIIFPVILFFFLTIGNYSFLRYSIQGIEITSKLLNIISGLRLIIPVWIVLYSFKLDLKFTLNILKYNIDVVALGLSWLLSGIFSMDTSSYLLYGVWTLISLCAILLFIAYSAITSYTLSEFLLNILDTLWYGNIIIVILDLGSLAFFKPERGILNMFFSSNSFWAYPTMIIGILSLIKIRCTPVIFKKLFYILIFLISLISIYFSARRSPLFCLVLTLPLLYIPLKSSRFILLILLSVATYSLADSLTGKEFLDSLPDSYMKYRIERMFGLIEGREETSYAERQKIWHAYLDAFYNKPVLGEGLAAVNRITSNKKSKTDRLSAHNTFIGLLAETGLSGSLLLIIVILRSILIGLRIKKTAWVTIYIVLFIPTLLINWVEYNLIPGQIFFLFTIIVWLLPRGLLYLKI